MSPLTSSRELMLACFLPLPHLASAECEQWCTDSCSVLNGPLDRECDTCSQEEGYLCYPGAVDYDTWRVRHVARTQRTIVDANGRVVQPNARVDDPDAPIERTHKSMVYREPYFNIAARKRDAAFEENPSYREFLQVPLAEPAESPRMCEVHSCVLVEDDEACVEGRADCAAPRGHLRPFGEQFEVVTPVAEHDVHTNPLSALSFWRRHVATYSPVVLRDAAAAITKLDGWSDEALRAPYQGGSPKCALENGRPFPVIVEKNNRVSHNDRHPLEPGWNFCDFLAAYRAPDAPNYCINSITEDSLVPLTKHLKLPEVLACDDLYSSMSGIRMWMSRGNTTCSQHFDTHDVLLFQIDGVKEFHLSHPNESAAMYMDHHDKYGLSPINVDRVDLQRFPRLADAEVHHALLSAGDALYIPSGWWHVISSRLGRNIMLAFEFDPTRRLPQPWTTELRKLSNHPGLFWAEKKRLLATMAESTARAMAAGGVAVESSQCSASLSQTPRNLSEYPGWRGPRYD